jgi:hypothetical protein
MIGEMVTVTLPDGRQVQGRIASLLADVRDLPTEDGWTRVEAAGTWSMTIEEIDRPESPS